MLWMELALRGKTALLSGGFYYRVYPASFGLSMPLGALVDASKRFELDLLHRLSKTERGLGIWYSWRKSNDRLIVGRWKKVFSVAEPKTWHLVKMLPYLVMHYGRILINRTKRVKNFRGYYACRGTSRLYGVVSATQAVGIASF